MGRTSSGRAGIVVLLAVLVTVAFLPGVVAAQETRTGGTVVVGPDERVDDLTVFGGNVYVEGVVEGNLDAFAGNVFVNGVIEGDVDAVAGNVHVAGDVGGDVSAVGGNVVLERDGEVAGSFSAAAGTVVVRGTIDGDAEVGAGSIVVESTAVVGGDLTYGGALERHPDAQVGGVVTQNGEVTVGITEPVPTIPAWFGALYGFLANLLLGALLLLVAPGFSREVAGRVRNEPLVAGGVGLLTLIGVPIALVLLAITIVGIPLAILGALLFATTVWIGVVYGGFALGTWLLSLVDEGNRWAALALGLLLLAVLGVIPFLGGLVGFVVLLLGLGSLALSLRHRVGRQRSGPPETEAGTPASAS